MNNLNANSLKKILFEIIPRQSKTEPKQTLCFPLLHDGRHPCHSLQDEVFEVAVRVRQFSFAFQCLSKFVSK